MTAKEIEAKAKRLGARRGRHASEGAAIQTEVEKIVPKARVAGVPMATLADLLGMHRSSLYELYIGGSDDGEKARGDAAAKAA